MHFDALRGWICDVPQALTSGELQRVVAYTLRAQTDRMRGMLPGDRKDQARVALGLLASKGWRCVQQNIVAPGEKVLYKK